VRAHRHPARGVGRNFAKFLCDAVRVSHRVVDARVVHWRLLRVTPRLSCASETRARETHVTIAVVVGMASCASARGASAPRLMRASGARAREVVRGRARRATRAGSSVARRASGGDGDNDGVPDVYVEFAKRLAIEAGKVTTKYFRADALAVLDKSDASPVTIADQTAEAVMRAMVTKELPTHAIFGEEHGIELGAGGESEWTWVFDPIDGTKSFITGKPLWGTLIALLHNGEPVLGVLDQPVLKEQWVGVKGRQSTMNGKPIKVKPCENLGDAFMYSTTPLMFEGMNKARYEKLASEVKIPMFGCDCYAYGLLAMGFCDLVVEADLKPYDYMALVPIVKGAGGMMTDWKGEELKFTADAAAIESGSYQGEVIAACDEKILAKCVRVLSKTLF
jgi:inositol-phosphate phosphatase / L-galactose 1-phosphate phosphatase / histidinol-phosphatase